MLTRIWFSLRSRGDGRASFSLSKWTESSARALQTAGSVGICLRLPISRDRLSQEANVSRERSGTRRCSFLSALPHLFISSWTNCFPKNGKENRQLQTPPFGLRTLLSIKYSSMSGHSPRQDGSETWSWEHQQASRWGNKDVDNTAARFQSIFRVSY